MQTFDEFERVRVDRIRYRPRAPVRIGACETYRRRPHAYIYICAVRICSRLHGNCNCVAIDVYVYVYIIIIITYALYLTLSAYIIIIMYLEFECACMRICAYNYIYNYNYKHIKYPANFLDGLDPGTYITTGTRAAGSFYGKN